MTAGTLALPDGDWSTGQSLGRGRCHRAITVGSGATLSTSAGVTEIKNGHHAQRRHRQLARADLRPDAWANLFLSSNIIAGDAATSTINSQITLNNNRDITVDTGSTLNINGKVTSWAGPGSGITKNGDGTLALSAANSYTGLTARRSGKAGGFINTPLTLPVLGFLAIALATFIAGLGNAPPTQTVLRHFAEVILSILLFFLITDTVRDQPRLNLVTKLLIIGGSLAALLAVILYLLPDQTSMELLSRLKVFNYPEGPGVLRYIRDDPRLPQRATGTSVDPNGLGGLLILTLTLAVPHCLLSVRCCDGAG